MPRVNDKQEERQLHFIIHSHFVIVLRNEVIPIQNHIAQRDRKIQTVGLAACEWLRQA